VSDKPKLPIPPTPSLSHQAATSLFSKSMIFFSVEMFICAGYSAFFFSFELNFSWNKVYLGSLPSTFSHTAFDNIVHHPSPKPYTSIQPCPANEKKKEMESEYERVAPSI